MLNKQLNAVDDVITGWFNKLPKSWGLGMCGHTFIDSHERFIIFDRNTMESYSYDQYICTKCGVEERRNLTQDRVEERKLFTKCDGTGGWKLPECLQF